jgi:hypothetical protein
MCNGCSRQKAEGGCEMYDFPERQHTRLGGCAGRTHNRTRGVEESKPMNPLKASKRGISQK